MEWECRVVEVKLRAEIYLKASYASNTGYSVNSYQSRSEGRAVRLLMSRGMKKAQYLKFLPFGL